ncbi:uncharacterized protein LOC122575315 isoform X5 [Bombus pyrosoma]|uniref:uncharacterized protein LOC122575315 isoform X5 n=1 Tax=Bombus pyrosoma TaxID=396416 RepID=UPI001CB9894F|nr:uncharacterized protein LOC122575315 isoform X5 [Bombus pyrosoma]
MGRRKHRSKGSKLPPLRSSKCNVACEKSTTCDEAKAKEERERRGTTEKTITPDVMRYQKERTECFHQTNDPIGVRSRLMYPLVQPSLFLINSSILSEENESVEDECIELKVKPRFLAPNGEIEPNGLFIYLARNSNSKKLHLILIGPELQLPKDVPPRLLSMVPICKKCKSAGRAVIVTFKPEKLYHCLVRDPSQTLATPDLICLFNPGLYRTTGFAGKDTWLETIREFSKTLAPTTITSYTAQEMLWEINRINSVADVEVLLQPCKNPFASVKPDRNFVSDNTNPLIYKNYYITIVKGKSIVL